MLLEDLLRQVVFASMETRCVIEKDREEGKVKGANTGLFLLRTLNWEALLVARLFCTLNDLITDEHVGHSVREETKEPFQTQQNPFNTTPFDSKNVLTAIPVLKPLK